VPVIKRTPSLSQGGDMKNGEGAMKKKRIGANVKRKERERKKNTWKVQEENICKRGKLANGLQGVP
jgi:hypothetical protein